MDKRLSNIHPGEILEKDFLVPMDITPYRLAKETNIDQKRISDIIKGRRRITTDTALRLSKFFGNSARFWLNIQSHYDLERKLVEMEKDLKKIKTYNQERAS